ncbi:MAG: gfo/Idh/MocA family oxidoreductase, partial [Verrucomicrobia bacterium]|nr:gfo/Idh/MocA family oxidoreductase [Verrucomicrobiota bacterium]
MRTTGASSRWPRRAFLRRAAIAGLGLGGVGRLSLRVLGANERVSLAVMGTNGRGSDLARGFAALERAQITHICDVDERAVAKGLAAVGTRQEKRPEAVRDFREALE